MSMFRKKRYVNVIRFSQALQDEVGRLTELINTTSGNESVAIFLCRRGAVHRKVSLIYTQTSLGAVPHLTWMKKKTDPANCNALFTLICCSLKKEKQ